jgi:hypothetical protein
MSPDASRMWIRMAQKPIPAILELRHTPAVLVKTEVASRPASPGNLMMEVDSNWITNKNVEMFFVFFCYLKKSPPEESPAHSPSAQEGNLTRLVHLAQKIRIQERWRQPATTSQSGVCSRPANVRVILADCRVGSHETLETQFILQRSRVWRNLMGKKNAIKMIGWFIISFMFC